MICQHCKTWLGAVDDDGNHDCLLGQEAFKARARELPLRPVSRDPDKGTFLSPDLTDDEARFKAMLAIQAHRRDCCARSSHRDCNWQGVFRGVEVTTAKGEKKIRWHPFMGRACTPETECSACRKEKAVAARRRVTGADYRSIAVPKEAPANVVTVTVTPRQAAVLKLKLAMLRASKEA